MDKKQTLQLFKDRQKEIIEAFDELRERMAEVEGLYYQELKDIEITDQEKTMIKVMHAEYYELAKKIESLQNI